MIDPKLFTVERLLLTMLDTQSGNHNRWWSLADILPAYKAPHAQEGTRPKCVVRVRTTTGGALYTAYLRHSAGPRQGHFWDMYGDDYLSPELALMALLQAPTPPGFIDSAVWSEAARTDLIGEP